MALAIDNASGVPAPGYACSSTGRWHFLYFLPLPHQQGAFRPTLRFPAVSGRCRAAEVRARVRAPGGRGWRLEVPGYLRDETASGGIDLRELVLLRRGQLPTQSVYPSVSSTSRRRPHSTSCRADLPRCLARRPPPGLLKPRQPRRRAIFQGAPRAAASCPASRITRALIRAV